MSVSGRSAPVRQAKVKPCKRAAAGARSPRDAPAANRYCVRMSVPAASTPPRAAWRRVFVLGAATLYALAGLWALVWLSPRVPYADEWRQFTRLLSEPFGRGVLGVDNGHAEILPNVLRWADLRLAHGHEVLIVLGALLCLTAACVLLWRALARDATLDASRRAAAAFALAFGVFWLGNVHALAVLEDTAHVAPLLLCVCAALTLVAASSPLRASGLAGIAVCAVLAPLTFGSGWALFPALALAFALRRDGVRGFVALTLAAAVALVMYFTLPGAANAPEGGASLAAVPLRTLQLLGAPFQYLFWPLLDPAAAAAVPGPLRGLALAVAQAWTDHVGDIRNSTVPQALVGAVFCALFLAGCVRAWRAPAGPMQRLGLALAAFALACAVLIAFARAAYFDAHPDQVYALRYVPWAVLGWCGLLLAGVARATPSRGAARLAFALALLALPSEVGFAVLARHMREVAEDNALGVAVGVLPADQALGENPLDDLRGARRAFRLAQTSITAWPEAQALQRELPAGASAVPAPNLAQRVIVNQFGGSGSSIDAGVLAAPACAQRLLLARDSMGIGLLRRSPDGHWRGVATDEPQDGLQVFALCR